MGQWEFHLILKWKHGHCTVAKPNDRENWPRSKLYQIAQPSTFRRRKLHKDLKLTLSPTHLEPHEFFSLFESKHVAKLCLAARTLLLSSSMGSQAVHLWPETSWKCTLTTRAAEGRRRRRSGMQGEVQPWVHNTSGENMVGKHKAETVDAVYGLHSGAGLWWNTLPPLSFLSQSFTRANSKLYKDASASR